MPELLCENCGRSTGLILQSETEGWSYPLCDECMTPEVEALHRADSHNFAIRPVETVDLLDSFDPPGDAP